MQPPIIPIQNMLPFIHIYSDTGEFYITAQKCAAGAAAGSTSMHGRCCQADLNKSTRDPLKKLAST